MTDNTEHKPGCEALGGYGHGIGPCSCSEAQPEALRQELHQECADFATSLRSAANVVQLQGQKAPPSFLKAADLFEQAASEIQQLKAEKAEMAALNYENYEFQRKKADAATATVYRFHYAMKDAGWHPGRTDDDLTDIIRAKGRELAQLSARQAAPDGWRLVPVDATRSMINAAAAVEEDGYDAMHKAMLSASPPHPEREPLTDEQICAIAANPICCPAPYWWLKDEVVLSDVQNGAITFAQAIERAHGIGATNG